MNSFIENNLCVLIIGDEKNEKFDGRIKTCGKEEGFRYHTDSVKQIAAQLNYEGYSIGKIDYSHINETGFDIINKGHVLFCNCSSGNVLFGYLFIPEHLTDKQIESLKIYEEQFQKFGLLYLVKIDKNDKESFDSITFEGNFSVDAVISPEDKVKTK